MRVQRQSLRGLQPTQVSSPKAIQQCIIMYSMYYNVCMTLCMYYVCILHRIRNSIRIYDNALSDSLTAPSFLWQEPWGSWRQGLKEHGSRRCFLSQHGEDGLRCLARQALGALAALQIAAGIASCKALGLQASKTCSLLSKERGFRVFYSLVTDSVRCRKLIPAKAS